MRRIFQGKYLYWAIGIFFLYLVLNLLISGFYNTIPLIIKYAETVNWSTLLISVIFSLTIGVLVAINAVYVYIRYKERRQCKEANVLAGAGTIGGIATGFCHLCVAGLFPIIFGIFGLNFSFALLPLRGIEVQIIVILILIVSLFLLGRNRKRETFK